MRSVACMRHKWHVHSSAVVCAGRASHASPDWVLVCWKQLARDSVKWLFLRNDIYFLLRAVCRLSMWCECKTHLGHVGLFFFFFCVCVLMPIWSKIANTATTATTTAKIMFYNDSMYFCFSQALSFAVLTPSWCFASRTTCYQNHTWNILVLSLLQQSLYEPACIVFNVFLFLFHFKALKKNSNYAYYLRHGRASSLVPVCLCHIHEAWAALTQTCQSAKCPKKKRKEIKFSSYTSQRRLCLTQVLNAFWTHSINMK